MQLKRNLWAVGSGALLLAALTLSGCATEGPLPIVGLEQKVATAQVRADHDEIASLYEQQAGIDKASAERHRRLAQVYSGRTSRNVPPNMGAHCLSLARIYQQAAEENLALAKQHRLIAHDTKK